MIVLELAETACEDLLTNQEDGDDLPAWQLVLWAGDVAAAMEYLSSRGYIHRDLACRNILVCEGGTAKVADFGRTRDVMVQDGLYTAGAGKVPIRWTSYEALAYGTYSTASDVWSYGIVLYELWTEGQQPYDPTWSNPKVFEEVSRGYRLQPPSFCPERIAELMMECWHPAAKERPQFEAIAAQFRTWTPADTEAWVGETAAQELQQRYTDVDVRDLNQSRVGDVLPAGDGFYSAVGSLNASVSAGGYESAIRGVGSQDGGVDEGPYKMAETPERANGYEMPRGVACVSPADPSRLQSTAYANSSTPPPPTPPQRARTTVGNAAAQQHPSRMQSDGYKDEAPPTPPQRARTTKGSDLTTKSPLTEDDYAEIPSPAASPASSPATAAAATAAAAAAAPSSRGDGNSGEPLYRPIYAVPAAATHSDSSTKRNAGSTAITAPTSREPTSQLPPVPASTLPSLPPPDFTAQFRMFKSTRKTNPLYRSMVGSDNDGDEGEALYAEPADLKSSTDGGGGEGEGEALYAEPLDALYAEPSDPASIEGSGIRSNGGEEDSVGRGSSGGSKGVLYERGRRRGLGDESSMASGDGNGGHIDAVYATPNKSPQLPRRGATGLNANPLQLTPESSTGPLKLPFSPAQGRERKGTEQLTSKWVESFQNRMTTNGEAPVKSKTKPAATAAAAAAGEVAADTTKPQAAPLELAKLRLLDDRGSSPLAAFSIAEEQPGTRDSKRPAKNTAKWMKDWEARQQQQKPK